MPGISDPGQFLIHQCYEAQIVVEVIPGPCAAISAVVLSGFVSDCFSFFGFLPRKGQERKRVLEQITQSAGTIILYESPLRLGATLEALNQLLGARQAAVIREITKIHQERKKATLAELTNYYKSESPKGEITIVIEAAAGGEEKLHDEQLISLIQDRLSAGESPRQIAYLLAQFGKRRVYQLALSLVSESAQ